MELTSPQFLVVVLGFNRPLSLKRLLASLESIESVACKADLVVSIDGGGDSECALVASGVQWSHGRSEVVVHESRMGLKTHVETATDRVKDYDAVIVLEDDLSVSPWMLHYCLEAFSSYDESDEIAQISLYSHHINEFSGFPFRPVAYEFDSWFARVPSSWGQMYTRRQWARYRSWQEQQSSSAELGQIPPSVYQWKHSWKRSFFEYVSSGGLWTVYPYHSLTTNHGDVGANYLEGTQDLQVPLEMTRREYHFGNSRATNARYDEWFEVLPDTLGLNLPPGEELAVDLAGLKPINRQSAGYMLSSRPCAVSLARYSCGLVPLELNIRLGRHPEEGRCISLGRIADFQECEAPGELAARQAPRGIYSFWFNRGIAHGHQQIRADPRYRLGSAVVAPIRRILQCLGLRK